MNRYQFWVVTRAFSTSVIYYWQPGNLATWRLAGNLLATGIASCCQLLPVERAAIDDWFKTHNTDPMTGEALLITYVFQDTDMRSKCKNNACKSVSQHAYDRKVEGGAEDKVERNKQSGRGGGRGGRGGRG